MIGWMGRTGWIFAGGESVTADDWEFRVPVVVLAPPSGVGFTLLGL